MKSILLASLLIVARAAAQETAVLPVTSPAFFFSPGNWTGDTGRGGSVFRQSWYPGSYFRVTWNTTNANPTAELLLDISTYGDKVKNPPEITYEIDGRWTSGVKCAGSIPIRDLKGPGPHVLSVYFSTSEQSDRWGTPTASGLNVVRVTGLRLNRDSTPVPAAPTKRWALIVGDSITEGSAANNGKSDSLASWSYFTGSALQELGYEYGVSACGYSGWLRPGDRGGDVPPYYQLSGSGGFDEARSRWNKIDARNSLLDSKGRLSGYGDPNQEPSAILINFGTNDELSKVKPADLQSSITGSLKALRKASPAAEIFLIVPFGQYAVNELKASVASLDDYRISIIDLGESVAKGLAANNYWSGLHPNMRGHATFAARILARIAPKLFLVVPGK